MDTQKVLQTLLKIAQNQQTMIKEQQKQIEQLKQAQLLPPQKLDPNKPELHPEQLVLESLHPSVRAVLQQPTPIAARGTELQVSFQPGKASQSALDHITKTVQHLVSQNKLPFPYTVRAV
jgi:hypothetical protein